ncbi:MAG TPA: 30S ribosomal protein S11 [Candidatus Syntrophosphaera sp.]|jgi:small subunit ribosomal protein S11|nr:30S ribosomal protein S11 [Candidatus Cloacimonadota bacterium]OQB92595.1 MAG: 30S ribosomal protein S11 [Candidatus Cloacimonetes bacterium ADurb.Bin117]HNU54240.1 30S ribosomal protein S11 [Candidatus Syntrophosphaera sp.]MDI9525057.1 30S ribosomal protein S11 [Candidatus Cloacimonadota bacterium]NLH93300.1 30S ribosomal protein S11 [Candidatus Cloacimonadota bacterium]
MAKKTRIKKKRVRLSFDEGIVFVHSSFNNTIVSLADRSGNILTWSSGGRVGYKGSRKATPFAAQLAATEVSKTGLEMGLTRVGVIVRGPGSGRESAIRAVNASGLKVTMIKDATPIPHNGCRPPKTRRI